MGFTIFTVSQKLIGNVDIKTRTVHFYVTRNSTFSTHEAVIPFELAFLNEGGAMNLASGIFTAPVPGIYHFEFSGVKATYANYLVVDIQVNGARIGVAYTNQFSTGSLNGVSLSSSFRLAANDRVNLFNYNTGGVLFDGTAHQTHFTGWLVEESLI